MEAIADVRGAACKNSATRWTAPIRSLGFTKGSYHLQKVDERHEEGPGLVARGLLDLCRRTQAARHHSAMRECIT